MNSTKAFNCSCTVCGSEKSTTLYSKHNRHAEELIVNRCNNCKAVFLSSYSGNYEDSIYDYYNSYIGKSEAELFSELTRQSYLNVLNLISSNVQGRSILDVGCGKGDFVRAAVMDGWQIDGIELNRQAVSIAKGFSLPVKQLDFFSDEIKPSSYDVVSMFEVLEHLPDPVGFLKRAENVVRPGGVIYLTTPNFASLDRRIWGVDWPVIHKEHLTYFSIRFLKSVIRKNTNLTVLHEETRNISEQSIQLIRGLLTSRSFDRKPLNHSEKIEKPDLRTTLNASAFLRALKRSINGFLNITGTGGTIVLLLKRP